MKKTIYYKIPAIVYALLIFGLSSIPKSRMPEMAFWNFDKLIHIVEYAVFALFLMLAFRSSNNAKITAAARYWSLVSGVLYGMLDEFHQIFVPGRTASVFDLGADALGICLGIWLFNHLHIFAKFREYEFKQTTD